MKKYEKIQMTLVSIDNKNMICNLANWLEGESMYSDAGITTYQIES